MIIVVVIAVIAIALVIYFFKKKKTTELASRPTTPAELKIQNESTGTPTPAPAPIVPAATTAPLMVAVSGRMSAAPNPYRTPAPTGPVYIPRGA